MGRRFLIGLLSLVGVLGLGPWCVRVYAAGFQETAAKAETYPSKPTVGVEPAQVRAARRFLARRGLGSGASSGRLKPILHFAQADSSLRRGSAAGISLEVSGTAVWTAAGPVAVNSLSYGLVTGRVSAVALDPSDATGNTVFVGTTGGGLWKSQNAAATTPGSVQFLPLTDDLGALSSAAQAGISVGAVTVQPGATGVVLAGLGDPNDALDSYYGAGLLRSTDGGQTWALIEQTMDLEEGLSTQDFSFVGEGFAGFAWSTANVQLVVAAVSQAYEGTVVNAGESFTSYEGLYWSNDAGATWHLARITDQSGQDVQGPADLFSSPDGNAATSVVWNPVRRVFVAAVRYHGYYQSTDGMNWTQMAAQPGSGLTAANCPTESGTAGVAGCPIFRGSLAVNPQTGDTFAWTVDEFNQDQGIWRDSCGPSGVGSAAACTNSAITFGVELGTAALETSDGNGAATIENGDYNLTLAAVPSGQDTLLFAGDNDLWKCSLANSCAWRNTTNSTTCMSAQVGEYQHGLAWDAGNTLLLFAGTDSGLWRSTDDVGETGSVCAATDATHWQNLNGSLGSLAEVVSLGQSSATAATMLTGMGANGFAGVVNAPATAGDWNEVLSGEGGPVEINPASTVNDWYANNAAGVSILRCNSATACTAAGFGTAPVIGETQVEEDGLSMPYPAEFRLDAADATQILIGTCRLWRGPVTGSGWSTVNAISPILDGLGGSTCNGNALIRTIAEMAIPGGGEVIYIGMAGSADGGGVVPGHVFSATISSAGVVSNWTDLAYSPVVNNELAFNAFGMDVSSLYIDSHDATGGTVYATISGFANSAEPLQQLYQSTDGGVHWTAIRANLPNAPANAVVVDAQDPETVYVAMDVGVFVTRAIDACGTGSACWAAYGAGLPLAPVTQLMTTSTGATSQVLTAGTYGRGVWQIPTATAGVTVTTATVSPTSLTFASQTVGTASTAQTVTLKATGTSSLTVSSVGMTGSAAGDFSETDTCVGATIAKNATCALKVSITPAATGSRVGNLAIQANVSGGQLLVPLTGTGLATANVTLLPTSLSFGPQQVGTTSAVQSINIQNVGGSSVVLSSITVSAPFKKGTSTCGSSLAAGVACAVTVDFAPTASGAATGSFTVVDGVGTQSAALSGTGLLAPTDVLSTTSLFFASTVLGQVSPPLTVTITNNGGLPLTNIGTSVSSSSGTGSDFTAVSNCEGQLAANSSCVVTVGFSPSVAAAESGTLVISDALKAQSVTLRGTGLKPPAIGLSPISIAFGSRQLNIASAAKTLTITNTGGAPLASPSFSMAGPGSTSFSVGTTTCGTSVAAAGTCTVQVIFTPLVVGATTATLTVATSSTGVASVSTALSGTGLTPPMLGVVPAMGNLGTVDVGFSSGLFTVQVTNTGQVAMIGPTFAVSGISGPSGAQLGDFALSAPTDIAACTGTLNVGATCNIQVQFSPSVVGMESAVLTVTGSNAIPPTSTVSLTGTGAPPIMLQPSVGELSFPATPVGTATAPLTLTISNLGRQTANGLTLSPAGPYSVVPGSTTCTTTLTAASSCTVGVMYAPTASGMQPGELTVSVSNLGVEPLVIPLNGSGIAVGGIEPNPTQMTFGSLVVNTQSVAQTLTVTNSGQAALEGLAILATGDFSLIGNQCSETLQAGASCTTGVVFMPSVTGIRTGTLTINTSSAGVAPSVVPLTGNGIPTGSLMTNPAVVSFASVTLGQTSPAQSVTVSNTGVTTLAGLQFSVAGDYIVTQNGCGTQLTSGAMCSFTVTFSPSLPGTRIGSVTIQSTATGFTPLVVGLTGTGLPTAQLVVTPGELALGAVEIGTNSTALQLTVTNPGTGVLSGLSFATANPFSVGSGCGTSLPAGGTCMVPVTFAPVVGGIQNGVLAVSTTSLGVSPVRVALSGTGLLPPSLNISPAALNFTGMTVGSTSAGQTVSVSNPGQEALSGLNVAVSGPASGDFAMASSSCTGTLAGGGSCSVVVSFKPTAVGGRQGFLTASSTTNGVGNVPIPSVITSLNGTGLTPASLSTSPTQLTFAPMLIGQTSVTQTVTVENSGQSGITDLQLMVTGAFALDSAKTTCTQALNAGATCVAGVLFAPTAAGAVSGLLTASSVTAGSASATTALSGTGALPSGIATTPAAVVQFGTIGVGLAGQPVQVTVSNQGTLTALTGLALAVDVTGKASGFGLTSNTCGATLAAGASCTANVTFVPTAAGASTGALTVTSTNGTNQVSLDLVGIGFDFQIAVQGNSSASVVQGQTANYTLTLMTLGGAPGGNFSFQCANLPSQATCAFNPAQLGVLPTNVTGNVVLGIETGAPTASESLRHEWRGIALLLCGVLALPLGWRRRKFPLQMLLLIVVLAGLVGGMSSCAGSGTGSGGGSSSGGGGGQPPPAGGSPSGSYTVTVTASAAGVVHSTPVTLVVN